MKLILPILADIGHGILASLVVGLLTETPLTWHFLAGIGFALLPDLDAVPRLVRTGSVVATNDEPRDHREYMHYPILFLIVGCAILVFSTFWGSLFIVSTMLHFLNDTWGTGHGLAWLAPFSRRTVKIRWFDEYGRTSQIRKAYVPGGDWVDRVYLSVNPISVIEYATFGIALVLLLLYFSY